MRRNTLGRRNAGMVGSDYAFGITLTHWDLVAAHPLKRADKKSAPPGTGLEVVVGCSWNRKHAANHMPDL